jgi:hypothetical protein
MNVLMMMGSQLTTPGYCGWISTPLAMASNRHRRIRVHWSSSRLNSSYCDLVCRRLLQADPGPDHGFCNCHQEYIWRKSLSRTRNFANWANYIQFGLIFFYNDWAATAGFIPPLMMSMALGVGITVIGMCIFIPYGKFFRRRTMSSSLHFL